MKVLWIEDQPHFYSGARKIFERMGLEMTFCRTVEQGVRAYNNDFFDAIILDRNAPREDILWPKDRVADTSDQGTGEALLLDIRSRFHTSDIPVVFWTEYGSDSFKDRVAEIDPRVKVLSKNEFADVVAQIVIDLIRQFPQKHREPIVSLATDHYHVARYYINDGEEKKRVAVMFETAPTPKTVRDATHRNRDFFLTVVSQFPDRVESVVSSEQPEGAFGIYFAGPPNANWRHLVLFETRPDDRFANQARRYSGIGKAMVVRFLRQCMREFGHTEEDIKIDEQRFNELRARLHGGNEHVRNFLKRLGFVEAEGEEPRGMLVMTHQRALKLIEEVSDPGYREPNEG